MWSEVYYIPFEENRGIYLSLSGPSESDVATLRQFLLRIKIPADAHIIQPTPPPEPSLAQRNRAKIRTNLQLIMGAGEQCVLRSGFKIQRFTMPELRKEFGPALASVKPIDGEDYESLVWESGKVLRVETKTLGSVEFGP